jgi:hypothetical protein
MVNTTSNVRALPEGANDASRDPIKSAVGLGPDPLLATTRPTSAIDALVFLYRALPLDDQEEAFARLSDLRVEQLVSGESETALMLRSLRAVTDLVGHSPAPDDYREAKIALEVAGVEIVPLSRLIAHFGSWRRAKEALDLSSISSTRKIEARFKSRRIGKVWRYTEQTLRDTLARCVDEVGHVPQVAEYDWWREREIQLAAARGDQLHLPSASPFRKRWGSWAQALRALGYEVDDIERRLERP